MIGKLSGLVDSIGDDHAIVDVAGVGYLVHCPTSTLSHLLQGAAVSLAIETRAGEDAIRLYGFSTAEERDWFRLLQSVQSVGARVALNILSALSPRELERAVALSDKTTLGRAQGVGPKLATRLVTELKDKVPAMILKSAGHEPLPGALPPHGPEADAVLALVKLGYSQSQAAEAVARIAHDRVAAPVEELIKESLKAMAR